MRYKTRESYGEDEDEQIDSKTLPKQISREQQGISESMDIRNTIEMRCKYLEKT